MTGVTTFQKDVKTAYQYKRAPSHVRRRAKRSYRSWISNLLKAEGSRKFHYSGDQLWTTDLNSQAFFGWMNYGVNGLGGFDGTADMVDIFSRMDKELRRPDPPASVGPAGGTVSDQNQGGALSRRYYMDSMKCRAVLTNTGSTTIFWEVYECVARKDIPVLEAGNLQQFLTAMSNSAYQASLQNVTSGAGVPNTNASISGTGLPNKNTAGVTPFQFRHFCQNWKINKVTRMQAAAGNTVSFDCGQTRNVTVNWDNYNLLLAKKGVTKLMLFRQWGRVANVGGTAQNSVSSCAVEVQKDYNCKILDHRLPELNYMTYTNQTP